VSLREHDSHLHRCLQGSQPDAYVGLKRLFQRRCRIAKARLMPRPQRLLQLSVNPVSCQSAERGRRRLEAALDKLGTEALIPVLKSHSLASIERIDNLELLKPMAQLEVCVAELIEKRLAFRWFECDDSIRFSWICFQRSGVIAENFELTRGKARDGRSSSSESPLQQRPPARGTFFQSKGLRIWHGLTGQSFVGCDRDSPAPCSDATVGAGRVRRPELYSPRHHH